MATISNKIDPSEVGECSHQLIVEKLGDEVPQKETDLHLEGCSKVEEDDLSEETRQKLASGTLIIGEEIEGQRRGSTLVVANGYLYRRNYKNVKNDKNYLLCNQRYDQPYCYARAIYQNGLLHLTKEHNHLPDPIKVEQMKIKTRCKRRAEQETTTLREIVEEEQVNSGTFEIHPNFFGTLAKRRKSTLPNLPNTIDEFIQLLTENEERFCNSTNSPPFFSGFITADDFSIATFISPAFPAVLENVEVIHLDRMFTEVPSLFNHLCTILITVNEFVFPLVYGLMTSDSEAAYTILFNFVKQQLPNLNFKVAILDYDQQMHDALKSAYPLAETCSGIFHYSMAVWREVQEKQLINLYTENRDVQICIRMMLSLPLLPPEFGESGVAIIRQKIQQTQKGRLLLQGILDFIHHCWFSRMGAKSFSVVNEPQRSSLDVDAYLTKLKNKLATSSGNIWHFIERLKSFEELERKDFEKIVQGNQNRKKSGCLILNNKVRDPIEKLKNNKVSVCDVLGSIAVISCPPTNYSMDMYNAVHKNRVLPQFRPLYQIVSVAQISTDSLDTD